MARNQEVLTYLKSRRSVTLPFLVAPGPGPEELEELFEIATRVPDHGKIAPWRLVVFEKEARSAAGDKLAALLSARDPDADDEMLEAERNRFLPAPLTIGVISAVQEHPKVPPFEQLLSAGNVAFNVVHAAHALGYAAHWVTRWFAFDDEAARVLGAKDGERFVGFIHIGTAEMQPPDRERPLPSSKVEYWQG